MGRAGGCASRIESHFKSFLMDFMSKSFGHSIIFGSLRGDEQSNMHNILYSYDYKILYNKSGYCQCYFDLIGRI